MAKTTSKRRTSKSKKVAPRSSTMKVTVGRPKVKIEQAMASTATSGTTVHVVSHKNGWAVKREGSKRASKVSERKIAAVNHARSLIMKGSAQEVVIHKKDGKIHKRVRAKKK